MPGCNRPAAHILDKRQRIQPNEKASVQNQVDIFSLTGIVLLGTLLLLVLLRVWLSRLALLVLLVLAVFPPGADTRQEVLLAQPQDLGECLLIHGTDEQPSWSVCDR